MHTHATRAGKVYSYVSRTAYISGSSYMVRAPPFVCSCSSRSEPSSSAGKTRGEIKEMQSIFFYLPAKEKCARGEATQCATEELYRTKMTEEEGKGAKFVVPPPYSNSSQPFFSIYRGSSLSSVHTDLRIRTHYMDMLRRRRHHCIRSPHPHPSIHRTPASTLLTEGLKGSKA